MFIVISGNVRRIWYLAELLSTPYSHLFTRSLLCTYMHTYDYSAIFLQI